MQRKARHLADIYEKLGHYKKTFLEAMDEDINTPVAIAALFDLSKPSQSIQREEVGIKLNITPTINSDGYITTVIHPEVSSVVGFTGPDNSLPIISTRQANTTVRLKDGNSVIIGGLLSEEHTTNITKVPILGDIPGIGRLFQHRRSTTTKKDLVIEITPRIMPEQK